MTVEFRVLPVAEAVAWIRAWTDREWPMGIPEAFGIRDRLAWRPASDDGTLFTTKLSDDGRADGFIDDVDERGNVEGVRFPLSSRGEMGKMRSAILLRDRLTAPMSTRSPNCGARHLTTLETLIRSIRGCCPMT